jgi:hypothetical protein
MSPGLSVSSLSLSPLSSLTSSLLRRRYAEFVSSVLALTRGSDSFGIAGGGETMLLTDLQQIRVELVGLLERLASQLPTSKERKVFIINNVDQVYSRLLISHFDPLPHPSPSC